MITKYIIFISFKRNIRVSSPQDEYSPIPTSPEPPEAQLR